MKNRDVAFSEFLDMLEDALRARRLKSLPGTMQRRDKATREAFEDYFRSIGGEIPPSPGDGTSSVS